MNCFKKLQQVVHKQENAIFSYSCQASLNLETTTTRCSQESDLLTVYFTLNH